MTVEPGGQVEIATPPVAGLAPLVDAIRADTAAIRARLAAEDLVLVGRASDPLRPPRRILRVPRYAAMEAAFDRVGPHGRTMMCSTSAVQVCLDAGDGPAVTDRWQALHEIGPDARRDLRELPGGARPAHRLEVLADGELADARPGTDPAAGRRSAPTRPPSGPSGPSTPACSACAGTGRGAPRPR